MKSNKHILTALAIVVSAVLFSFVRQEDTLKVELPLESWNVVLEVIDQSNAPHQQVQAVKKVLMGQLQGQLQADSTTNKQ